MLLVTRREVFNSGSGLYLPHGQTDWTVAQLETVRFFLIEFAVNYRAKFGDEVKPHTMKFYITSLQRAFRDVWGYDLKLLTGFVFDCPKNVLMSVLNTRFSLQHAAGARTTRHNHLSIEDLKKLFRSDLCSRATPSGFLVA